MNYDSILNQLVLKHDTATNAIEARFSYVVIESCSEQLDTYEEGELTGTELPAWLRTNEAAPTKNLRLLLLPQANIQVTPLTSGIIDVVLRAWNLPLSCARIFTSRMPAVHCFDMHAHLPQFGFVFRNHAAQFCDFAIALLHDRERGRTNIFCTGLHHREVQSLQTCLRASGDQSRHWLLVPLLLCDLAIQDLGTFIERTYDATSIEATLNMDLYISRRSKARGSRLPRAKLDDVIRNLTSASNSIASLDCFAKTQLRFLGRLAELAASCHVESDTARVPESVPLPFSDRLAFLTQTLASARDELACAREMLQGQITTVYSLISQQDAELAMKAAKTSQQIAADSRRVAVLTRRDSADMRTIAVVTLVFLPGTFVATFFSTGFFKWDGDGGGGPVSEWVWIYWAVAGVLTTIVLVLWFVITQVMRHKDAENFAGVGHSVVAVVDKER